MKNLLLKLISFLSFRNYKHESTPETKSEVIDTEDIVKTIKKIQGNQELENKSKEHKEIPLKEFTEDDLDSYDFDLCDICAVKDENKPIRKPDLKLLDIPQISIIKLLIYDRFRHLDYFTSKQILNVLDDFYKHDFTDKQIHRAVYRLRTEGYITELPDAKHIYKPTSLLITFVEENFQDIWK